MVFVVISSVDCGEEVDRIPWNLVSAVISTGLHGGKGREHHAFPQRHSRANDAEYKGSDAEE